MGRGSPEFSRRALLLGAAPMAVGVVRAQLDIAASAATGNVAVAGAPWDLAQVLGGLVLGLTIVILVLVYVPPAWAMDLIVRHSHPSVLWRASTTSRVCALTIDDAPSPATPLILDLLRQHGIRATFFIISGNIPGNEAVVQRIVDEGHALGNHLTEDRASILDDLHVFEQKIRECDEAIGLYRRASPTGRTQSMDAVTSPGKSQVSVQAQGEADEQEPPGDDMSDASTRLLQQQSGASESTYGSVDCKWLRPASGWFTSTMREVIASHGYRICMGSVYPHDAQIKSETLNALYLRLRTRPGSVIIVHDRAWTVGVLRASLPQLVRQFQFVSLDELCAHDHNGTCM